MIEVPFVSDRSGRGSRTGRGGNRPEPAVSAASGRSPQAARWRVLPGRGTRVRVREAKASRPLELEARRRGRLTVGPERSRRLSPWSWEPVWHWRRRSLPHRLPLCLGQGWRVVGPVVSEQPRQPERRRLDGTARPVRVIPLVPYRAPRSAAHQHKSPASARSRQDHPARESRRIRRRTWHSPHHLWPARRPAPHLETLT
jgi:hypothetical protein